ncbi:MAG: 3,4-dihydroxy-2-butanone-4-phosphate synthase [Bdellovibrionales bacterium]
MNTIPELIEDIKQGKMVILVDDEDRENEGDLIIAADKITPELVNFMAKEACGLICLSLTEEQTKRLGLSMMIHDDFNQSPNQTAFTLSIEAATGVTTGISAADRAHTIKVASNPTSTSADIIVPGHIFPIKARKGGVLKRAGHTEASVDLVALAGLNPAAVICEVMNPDGTMARVPDLKEFGKKHDIKIGTIESLIQYRLETESFIVEKAEADFPSGYAEGFRVHIFENHLDGREHLALVKGQINSDQPVLVRVQSENVLGDVFSGLRSDTNSFIRSSMKQIEEFGHGVLVYLRGEDMASKLEETVKAYKSLDLGEVLSDDEKAVFNPDRKNYGVGAQILRSLGVKKINLLTNNPSGKRVGLKGYGLEIVQTTTLRVPSPGPYNAVEQLKPNRSEH